VLEHIGERLLHDAVRGQLDARREGALCSLDAHLHADTCVPHLVDERVELHEARLRCQRRVAGSFVFEDAHHTAEVGHRLAPGLLDDAKGCRSVTWIANRDALRRRRLEHHDAHAVRDHIMEFARDRGAFLGHRFPRQ